MAFEAFLNQRRVAPTRRRRVMVTLSLIFHGALVVAAFVHSFWRIEELSPPTVTVTFLSAAPPPPPPPPPPKRKSTPKTKPVPQKILAQPRPNEILQPRDKPIEKPDQDKSEEGGSEGGVEGGVSGGAVAAPTPPPPPPPPKKDEPPRFLPPAIAGQQLLTNPVTDPQYRVVMPPAFSQAGMRLWAMLKICVSKEGNVADVKVIKGMDPAVDGLLVDKIRTWKYKPANIDGHNVSFCYNLRYEHVPR
jgi:protein TonB